jgi:hypothetical protein
LSFAASLVRPSSSKTWGVSWATSAASSRFHA